jgi:hypothetical protein
MNRPYQPELGFPRRQSLGPRSPSSGKVNMLTHNGVTKPQRQWAREAGMSRDTFRKRVARGMSIDDALGVPIRTRHRELRDATLQKILELKKQPCADCHNNFPPCAMQFDHRPGEGKNFVISKARSHSYVDIQAELDRCDVVCACCHAIRTEARRVDALKNKFIYC